MQRLFSSNFCNMFLKEMNSAPRLVNAYVIPESICFVMLLLNILCGPKE